MRLIDADALKKAIIKHLCVKSEINLLPTEKSVYNCIDKQPTVEQQKEKDNPWRFFNFRQATEEEKERYIEEYGNDGADDLEMIENVPGDGEEVFLWTGRYFTVDTYDDGMFDGIGEIEKGMAWRYLPEKPKEGEHE